MTYSLAITSCNRHDLLRRTIESFTQCVSLNPVRTVILEDGPAPEPEWLKSFSPRLGKVSWINNADRMGQSYSIDRLYSELSTEYIFWCEDDWEFHESNFLSRSFQILRDHKEISMVALRSDWNHPLLQPGSSGGPSYEYAIAEPYWGGVWGGACWNPGLRRLSDYRRFGSYGRHVGYGTHGLGHEQIWSKIHLDAGFRIACLPYHCRHIGGDRSRSVEALELRIPRILIAIPACRTFDYGRWESGESPHYNRAHEAYGSDIHISHRENDRIQAVRDTWWKDIAAFAPNVEGRFFYGQGTEAQTSDEVILPVGNTYADLPAKTIAICKWALDNNFDFVLKLDDDSVCYIDRAVREVLNNRHMDYGGYCHCEIASGGPGYWLSKRAMREVVKAGPQNHWAEDQTVGITLAHANIMPVFLSTHAPGFKAHWFWPDEFDPSKLDPDMVTIHACQPHMMRLWYAHKENRS